MGSRDYFHVSGGLCPMPSVTQSRTTDKNYKANTVFLYFPPSFFLSRPLLVLTLRVAPSTSSTQRAFTVFQPAHSRWGRPCLFTLWNRGSGNQCKANPCCNGSSSFCQQHTNVWWRGRVPGPLRTSVLRNLYNLFSSWNYLCETYWSFSYPSLQ